jgi:MORN repeat variant
MKMQYFKIAVLGFVITNTFLLVSCKSDTASDITNVKADSVISTKPTEQKLDIKNTITPPDPDYTGDYTDKYPSGVIKFSGFFRFGKRHGQWRAFYENGLMWSECFYDKGERSGASNVYFPNGKPQYKGWFKKDLRDSLWLFFDSTGVQVDKRAFRNDQETGLVN